MSGSNGGGGDGFGFEREWQGSVPGFPMFRALEGVLNIGAAKLVTTGLPVGSSTDPAYTAGTPPTLLWGANAVTAVNWNFNFPDDYAEVKTVVANAAVNQDEVRILLQIISGASGTNPVSMTPTISYRRAGSASASAVAMTAYRKGLTREACAGIGLAAGNPFIAGAAFVCTNAPTNPEFVELQFRANGFKAGDAANFLLTPVAANHAATLYNAIMRPLRYAAPVLDPHWRR